jgi:hypothetical protein
MSALSKTAASLRFFGDDLNPEEVTQLLGKEPDKAERRGEVRPSGYTVRRGRWSVSAGRRTPGDLDSQIAELLAGMTDDLAVWQRLPLSITQTFSADFSWSRKTKASPYPLQHFNCWVNAGSSCAGYLCS